MDDDSKTSLSMLHGLRSQNPIQWERFFSVYSPLIALWCKRGGLPPDETDDIVQEVVRVVSQKIYEFRRDREEDTFHGWLRGITRFKILDHFRRIQKNEVGLGGSAGYQQMHQVPADPMTISDSELAQESDAQLVYERVLEILKTDFQPHTWRAFLRTTADQVPAAEVAKELEMTIGAVYNARHKVLRRLRNEFAEILELDHEV